MVVDPVGPAAPDGSGRSGESDPADPHPSRAGWENRPERGTHRSGRLGWGEWLSPRRVPVGMALLVMIVVIGGPILWVATPGWGVDKVDRTLFFEIVMGSGMILLLIGVWSIVRGLRDDLIDADSESRDRWKRRDDKPGTG